MKLLMLVTLGLALLAGTAGATATTSYSGTGTSKDPLTYTFTTNRLGDMSMSVTLIPKQGNLYGIRLVAAAGGYVCSHMFDNRSDPPVTSPIGCSSTQPWPAGTYSAVFYPVKSPTFATISVTAETD